MTQPASALWRPASKPRPWLRYGMIGVAVMSAAGILTLWIAGYFFLLSLHVNPRLATPLTIVRYAYYYGSYPVIRPRLLVSSGVSLGLVAAAVIVYGMPRRRSLHGEARFARRSEIARAGLFSHDGLILGELGSRYLMLPGQQSVILAAPPRSGKGVGIVIPNALHWPGSLVAIDIKRENWTISAGYRAAHGQACFLFDPLAEDGRTARWNCLSYVSPNHDQRINDIQRIADILYAEAPGADPFWVASARSLFLGIGLYLFETPSLPKTMGEIRRQGMATDDEGFGAHWKRIVEGRQSGRQPLSAECVRALYDVIDLAPVTASSVRKTFTSRLDLWANPLLDQATSGDDFDLRNLRKQPISIYVAVNPDDLHRLRPVLSLFFQQTLGLQTRELPEHNPELKYQVLMLLDECTALGRIPIVSESMAFLPGYNVRVLLVIQAPSQLREVYGPNAAETMLKSVAARIVFAPKDYSDAKEISDELGFTTVKSRSRSRPSAAALSRQRGGNVTLADHARALLLPQEVKEIGNERALIFFEGVRPIRCRKIRYFADRRFRARLLPPPAEPAPGGGVRRRQTPLTANEPLPTLAPSTEAGNALAPDTTVTPLRQASVSDIERLESLTLDDFGDALKSLNFEHTGKRPTDSELDADVNQFLAAMR
jgi:type IV secretion system protein VirD4